jgi:hypothetical protein
LNLSAREVTYRHRRLFDKLRLALAYYQGKPFGAKSRLPLFVIA